MNSNKNISNQMFIFDEMRKPQNSAREKSLNAELTITTEKNSYLIISENLVKNVGKKAERKYLME